VRADGVRTGLEAGGELPARVAIRVELVRSGIGGAAARRAVEIEIGDVLRRTGADERAALRGKHVDRRRAVVVSGDEVGGDAVAPRPALARAGYPTRSDVTSDRHQ